MAYFLQLDGVNDRVRCPIPPAVNTDWEIRLRVRSGGDTVGLWVEDDNFSTLFAITPEGDVNIKSRNTLVTFTHNVDITDRFHLYTLKYEGGTLTARVDGVFIGTTTNITFYSWDLFDATHFNLGAAYRSTGAVYYRDMDFDFFEIWHLGSRLRRWDSSAANGTGSVLPETITGADGDLIGFPVDDSQWVYFDDVTINTSEYARKVEITGLSPLADLTGYVALITEDNVPAEFWTTVQHGGGDVRVSTNTDGTGQLPIQVNVCDTDAMVFRAFVRFDSYTDLNRGCWIFYGKPGESHHDTTAQFGQFSTWQDYWLVVHGLTDLKDSTANSWDPLVVQGDPVPSLDKGILLTNGIKLDYDTPNLGVTDLSVSVVANVSWYHGLIIGSGSLKGATLFTTRAISANRSPTLIITQTGGNNANTGFLADSDSLAAGSDSTKAHATDIDFAISGTVDRDGTGGKYDGTWYGYDDGEQSPANNFALGNKNLAGGGFDGRVTIGRHPNWGNESSVNLKYLQAAKLVLPEEYVLLQQSNYKTPATFWTTGTPVDASEGAISGSIIDVNASQSQVQVNSQTLSVTLLQDFTGSPTELFLETEQNTVGQFVSLASTESQMLLESVTLDISNALALASIESELYIEVAPVVAQQVFALSAASSELVIASEVQAVAQSINLDAALSELNVATELNTVGQFVSLISVSSEAEFFAPAISTTSQVLVTTISSESEFFAPAISTTSQVPVTTISSEATIFSPAVNSTSQVPVASIDTQLRIKTLPITLEAENVVTAITSYLDIDAETGLPGYLSNVAISPSEVNLEAESNTVGYQVALTSVASEAVLNSATLTIEQALSTTAVASESDIKTVPASLDTASALVTVTTESLVEAQVLEAGQEIQLFAVSSESLVESETLNLSGELLLVAVVVESRLESETGIPGYQQDLDAVAVESPIQVDTLVLDSAFDLNVVVSESLIEVPPSTVDTLSDINPVVSELLLQTETLNLGALITVNAVETESLLEVNIIEIIQQKLDTGDSTIQPITTLTRFVLAPKTRIYKLTMK